MDCPSSNYRCIRYRVTNFNKLFKVIQKVKLPDNDFINLHMQQIIVQNMRKVTCYFAKTSLSYYTVQKYCPKLQPCGGSVKQRSVAHVHMTDRGVANANPICLPLLLWPYLVSFSK